MANQPSAERRSVRRVFDQVSRFYDTELLQRLVYRPIQDRVIAHLRPARPRRVVDVGCGTGIFPVRIHNELRPEATYGCDLSLGMLAQAEARSSDVGWINAGSEHLPLRDSAIDAVTSTSAFHFFDQPAALAEFHRVVAPGGLVVIAVPSPRTRAGQQLFAQGVRALGGGRFPTQRAMHSQVEAAGFRVVTQERAGGARGVVDPTVVTVARRRG